MKTENKRLLGILGIAAVLLLIPFVVGVIGGEQKWSKFDFALAAVILIGTALICELVLRFVRSTAYRVAICGAILLALLVVWVEIAVGVFGTRFAGS